MHGLMIAGWLGMLAMYLHAAVGLGMVVLLLGARLPCGFSVI